ncbi:uncharacterized protein TNCV_465891 [Trichonephila clavipes]|nr:uncharacterized protein TNCV_465891 [Trichonephila clavipes]
MASQFREDSVRNSYYVYLQVIFSQVQCRRGVIGTFVFGEPTVTGSAYLDASQLWLIPQLEESEPDNFIWQQDGAPPHWHLSVRDWLSITVSNNGLAAKAS